MQTNDFNYFLPEELIAKFPAAERTGSRLLHLDGKTGAIIHSTFADLCAFLQQGDLLVMNDTKVMPARLFGHKESGGKIEVMLERVLNEHEALAQIRASKAPKVNSKIIIANQLVQFVFEVTAKENALYHLKLLPALCKQQPTSGVDPTFTITTMLQQVGHIPLPPYIDRQPEHEDLERYQTVYAKTIGSVAAPTAGLHFDQALLAKIKAFGVDLGYVTLHVGAGTYQPIRVVNIADHHMHKEFLTVSNELCAKITATKNRGGRVIAVGTTTVRALETAALAAGAAGAAEAGGGVDAASCVAGAGIVSAEVGSACVVGSAGAAGGGANNAASRVAGAASAKAGSTAARQIQPFSGDTDIFIKPGFKFKVVDALITNFHLPMSTLLILTCAFGGKEHVLQAYHEAIKERYRFYSYGDAMFIYKTFE